MAVLLRCKMCGGRLEVEHGQTVVECEYCGSVQTVPTADNEKKMTLFSRANRLRASCEFDKAAGLYESIVVEFPEEAEAYWGLVLCRYGIEYVDDAATGRKIPTCHRSSFDSVLDDSNYLQVLEHADPSARRVYQAEAARLEEVRKGIIAVSSREKPYDIFICYKETDETGSRTLDSVIAQDIYDALVAKGYHVFFSRITLEDKLGQAYEPYIFAALNSAKLMLVVGTDYEHFQAVWVKNEWSRFLHLIAAHQKKFLIPCYQNMDPGDMPKEFARLQAQDMGKLGAMQDLLRGIEKLVPLAQAPKEQETVIVQNPTGTNVKTLMKRGFIQLEDEAWHDAHELFEQVLNAQPDCGTAYWGEFLAEQHCATAEACVQLRLSRTAECKASRKTCALAARADQESLVRKYSVPGYLDADTIGLVLRFDRSDYSSGTEAREQQYREEKNFFERERHIKRALQYGDQQLSDEIHRMQQRIYQEMERRIQREKQKDRNAEEAIQKDYAQFRKEAEQTLQAAFTAALEKQKGDQAAIQRNRSGLVVKQIVWVLVYLVLVLSFRDSLAQNVFDRTGGMPSGTELTAILVIIAAIPILFRLYSLSVKYKAVKVDEKIGVVSFVINLIVCGLICYFKTTFIQAFLADNWAPGQFGVTCGAAVVLTFVLSLFEYAIHAFFLEAIVPSGINDFDASDSGKGKRKK